MARVLHKLPFFDRTTSVSIAEDQLVIKSDQIVFWVSIAERHRAFLDPGTPRLPVILDTGLSHNFAIREEQLSQWAGLYPAALPILGHARLSGSPANLLDADVWVYRNKPGERDAWLDDSPFRLELEAGIAVYPRGSPTVARLPLLGLRGLRWARLRLAIDFSTNRVSLNTPQRFWFLG